MNKFLHILGAIAVAVGGVAAATTIIPFAPVVVPIAGGVATLCAYFSSNSISLSNAPQAALEAATVAAKTKADVQAALSKGNPNYGK
jgi:hypothetical protein